ncbi:hypothetical protein T492DRAFT_17308, partial [Pavlovales sp. CCMP2436]
MSGTPQDVCTVSSPPACTLALWVYIRACAFCAPTSMTRWESVLDSDHAWLYFRGQRIPPSPPKPDMPRARWATGSGSHAQKAPMLHNRKAMMAPATVMPTLIGIASTTGESSSCCTGAGSVFTSKSSATSATACSVEITSAVEWTTIAGAARGAASAERSGAMRPPTSARAPAGATNPLAEASAHTRKHARVEGTIAFL